MQRYVLEAQARCDELFDLLDDEQIRLLAAWIAIPENIDWKPIIHGPSPRALKILGQTPAQDAKWASKKDRGAFYREWVDARHWALEAANALEIAAYVESVNGMKVRPAIQRAAQGAAQGWGRPDIEDVLTLQFHIL